ncbi:MAG: hypothetical protein JO069_22305 [Verrucomicrobia bacterium]|nr:hypothetical protein [Verrucomicrobiota bacterium]
MSEFIYRKANLLAPETHALLGSVLVGIPKSAFDALKAASNRQHQPEDELFQELVTDSDYQIINQLLLPPFGHVSTRFEAFPLSETGDLPNADTTSADGKRFWRLGQRGS